MSRLGAILTWALDAVDRRKPGIGRIAAPGARPVAVTRSEERSNAATASSIPALATAAPKHGRAVSQPMIRRHIQDVT